MKLTIESISHRTLKFYNELPIKFLGPRLPGGEVLSASGDFGDLCVQEFDGGNFIVRYSVLQTNESFKLNLQSHHSGLHATVMLRNGIHPVFASGQEIEIDERQFTIFCAHEPRIILDLPGKQQFICFSALISHELAASVLKDFPELIDSLTDIPKNRVDIWVNPAKWTDEEVGEHIRYVLTYSDPVKWRRNYFENRVWDIVWKLVALHLNKNAEDDSLSRDDKQKADAVQRLVLDNLDKHLLIRELAKQIGVSESRLKRVFTIAFGMGIHKYRTVKRLQKAIQLLNEGLSVKETAAQTGWRPADLIKAYHKVYGTTPGATKKKK